MPEFTYAGQVPFSYTELRDEHGDIVGQAVHGDTRDLGGAPDERWIPAGEELPPAWPGVSADMYRLPEPGEGDSEPDAGEDDGPDETSDDPPAESPDGDADGATGEEI